jgi:hypothetical protein
MLRLMAFDDLLILNFIQAFAVMAGQWGTSR